MVMFDNLMGFPIHTGLDYFDKNHPLFLDTKRFKRTLSNLNQMRIMPNYREFCLISSLISVQLSPDYLL